MSDIYEIARAELFPIREMSDGSHEFAWPGTFRRAIDAMGVALGYQQPTYNQGRPLPDQLYDGAMDTAGLASAGALPMASPSGALRMGMRAYHGSPHDFDRFDISKIGTGEGAQAYGHGLYFAGNEAVAESYRKGLTQRPVIGNDGSVVFSKKYTLTDEDAFWKGAADRAESTSEAHAARNIIDMALTDAEGSVDEALAFIKKVQDHWPNGHAAAALARRALEDNRKMVQPGRPGRMYEVDLNVEPHQLLDWDKPLSEQPEMAETLKRLAPSVPADQRQYAAHTLYDPEFRSRIRESGIKGIQYLDQGSRTAGEGSRNFVIFDDNDVNIIRKYANPSTANIVTQMEREERSKRLGDLYRKGMLF